MKVRLNALSITLKFNTEVRTIQIFISLKVPEVISKFLGRKHLPEAGDDGSYNFFQKEHSASPDS